VDQQEDPFYNANLEEQPFNFNGYFLGQNRNRINQERFVKTNKIDAKLDYYYMVTPKSNINVTLGITNSVQNFDSAIFQVLDSGIVNNIDSIENKNNVKYQFNDVFLGLHYRLLTGKFTFNPGFSVHQYNTFNDQLNSRVRDDFYRVLPDVNVLYQIKKSQTLSYNYALTNDFTDIKNFAAGNTFNNYNALFRGNRLLENALSHTHSLRFFKYNMFNFENVAGNISYSKRINPVKNAADFNLINQTSTAINSNFADETISGFGSYGRSFLRYYKASLNVSGNWSKFNNIQNGTQQTNESFTQNYGVKASTNFKELPNIEFGFNYTINDYEGIKFFTERPSVRLDYYNN
jgi:hypothetical protein